MRPPLSTKRSNVLTICKKRGHSKSQTVTLIAHHNFSYSFSSKEDPRTQGRPSDLTLVLEMFNVEQQPLLDAYAHGEMSLYQLAEAYSQDIEVLRHTAFLIT